MKCPGCGYLSFDVLETCRQCGASLVGKSGPVLPPRNAPIVIAENDLEMGLFSRISTAREQDDRPLFSIDESIFQDLPRADVAPTSRDGSFKLPRLAFFGSGENSALSSVETPVPDGDRKRPAQVFSRFDAGLSPAAKAPAPDGDEDLPVPALLQSSRDAAVSADGVPIIDSDDEIPDDLWVPEVAGIGRRAAALLVDQALLATVLGLFFLGAFSAFELSGFNTDHFLSPAGMQAAALPFGLLAALLSLVYHAGFHGARGCTPGKALAGVEVRAGDGGELTWFRVILRWFCATLGVASAGAGLAWAIFEPRRRGWADLLSGTVIARRRRPGSDSRVSANP